MLEVYMYVLVVTTPIASPKTASVVLAGIEDVSDTG